MQTIARRLLHMLGMFAVLIGALIGAFAGFTGAYFLTAEDAPYEGAHLAVCHLLRVAQEKSLITKEQRTAWANNATPAVAVTKDPEDIAFYQSDCRKPSR